MKKVGDSWVGNPEIDILQKRNKQTKKKKKKKTARDLANLIGFSLENIRQLVDQKYYSG